ncbi:UNVERIFIED_CONTAM: hypothetical protein FKN15_057287 [Acipenser sinensis]
MRWYYCEYCGKENHHHWTECPEIQDWCGLCEHFGHLWQKCLQPDGMSGELVEEVPVREEEEQLLARRGRRGGVAILGRSWCKLQCPQGWSPSISTDSIATGGGPCSAVSIFADRIAPAGKASLTKVSISTISLGADSMAVHGPIDTLRSWPRTLTKSFGLLRESLDGVQMPHPDKIVRMRGQQQVIIDKLAVEHAYEKTCATVVEG